MHNLPTWEHSCLQMTDFAVPASRPKKSSSADAATGSSAGESKAKTWSDYFDAQQDIKLPNTEDSFRVYTAGDTKSACLFVLIHGGGLSAMSWAVAAGHIKKTHDVVSFDLRGHGDTHTSDDKDLSIEKLVSDGVTLLQTLYTEKPSRPFVLCGHSLGGAIAVRMAHTKKVVTLLPTAIGLTLALFAQTAAGGRYCCAGCRGRHRSRSAAAYGAHSRRATEEVRNHRGRCHLVVRRVSPTLSTVSNERVCLHSVKSNTVRNQESARISMPSQIVKARLVAVRMQFIADAGWPLADAR